MRAGSTLLVEPTEIEVHAADIFRSCFFSKLQGVTSSSQEGSEGMRQKLLISKTSMIGAVAATVLAAGVLLACGPGTEVSDGLESGGGEHGAAGEVSEGSGESSMSGGEEAGGANLGLDETFDQVRAGARLILGYDAPSNSFLGTVENTTGSVLTRVRIEVHLSNGTELGPTTPVDMAPGEVVAVDLAATPEPFTGWIPHAEVGGGESGGEGSGESGSEGSEGGGEIGEAAMSSPVTPLGQAWDGVLGGLAVSARYDAATQTIHTTVRNTLPQVLCYVQAEPHLKSGRSTVGELGPDMMGHLSPGQEATSILVVTGEPAMAGVAYDGYVIHMEVFDCGGTGPVPHTGGEGSEGGGVEGAGGEGHGPGGEGSGSEGSGAGGEEAGGAGLGLDETFDQVRAGARLILGYDAASNSFRGTVENTTGNVLPRVRIEVHLSNGTELGPTTPVDMAPGEVLAVDLAATPEPFTGWIPHAEVGGGEAGGEHAGEGESGGEHGSGGEGGSG